MTPPKRRLNDPPPLRVVRDDVAKPESPTPYSKPTKRDANRWHDLNQFVDITMRDLKPRQVAVWLTLFRDSRNGVASVSQVYLGERCGLQRPTVSTAIKELEALGLVTTIHTGGVGRGVSKYRVQKIIHPGGNVSKR
jgi:hypothetical protein